MHKTSTIFEKIYGRVIMQYNKDNQSDSKKHLQKWLLFNTAISLSAFCRIVFIALFGSVVLFGTAGCGLLAKDSYIEDDDDEDDEELEEEIDLSKISPQGSQSQKANASKDSRSSSLADDLSYQDLKPAKVCPKPKYFPKNPRELKKLVRNESISLGEIDVSKITDMKRLFFDAEEDENDPDIEYLIPLRYEFKGIECWDVSNVKDMSLMFKGLETFNEPLNDWDVSNVESMIAMFAGAEAFNQPLDKWNVSKVRSMKGMFYGTKVFNQPLDMWNIRNVKNMNKMFEKTPAYKQNLDAWGTKIRPDAIMKDMFKDSALERNAPKWLKK